MSFADMGVEETGSEVFTPIRLRVFIVLWTSLVFLLYTQIQMFTQYHQFQDELPIRLILIPFLYYCLIIINTIVLGEESETFYSHGLYYLIPEFKVYAAMPYQIHSFLFAFISLFFACHTKSLETIQYNQFSMGLPKESTCVVLWSIAHFVEFFIWVRLLRVCLRHNYRLDAIGRRSKTQQLNLSCIRLQMMRMSQLDHELSKNTDRIDRMKNVRRPYTEKEIDMQDNLEILIDMTQKLMYESRLLAAQCQATRIELDNKETLINEKSRQHESYRGVSMSNIESIKVLQKRLNQAASVYAENQILHKVAQEQHDQTRKLYNDLTTPEKRKKKRTKRKN